MSGNPFGLSEINHYGSMQRVGGKAAGFINKKFFHPSSLNNQEKLWAAITKQDKIDKEEKDAQSRKAEELQVEELKKQMYQRGQAPNTGDSLFISSTSGIGSEMDGKQKREQRVANEEQRRRKSILKEERAKAADGGAKDALEGDNDGAVPEDGGQAASSSAAASAPSAPLAKSKYPEDVRQFGHEEVWGSWFSMEAKRWGYKCCATMESKKRCPHAPEEVLPVEKEKVDRGSRGKRRRKGNQAGAGDNEVCDGTAVVADAASGSSVTAAPVFAGVAESSGVFPEATRAQDGAAEAANASSVTAAPVLAGVAESIGAISQVQNGAADDAGSCVKAADLETVLPSKGEPPGTELPPE